jgi:hypothetical protein
MDDRIRTFGEELGTKLLVRDWQGAHALLAPWLAGTIDADGIRAMLEAEYRSTVAQSDAPSEELQYPEYPEPDVGGNHFTSADELRKPMSWKPGFVRPVPPEVTNDNMVYWLCVKLSCSDEQMDRLGVDFLAEIWAAVVETPEGLRVGYWATDAYG